MSSESRSTASDGRLAAATSYERRVLRLLADEQRPAGTVRVTHQDRLVGLDGSYTVDGTLRFEQVGVEFLVIVECKLRRDRIKRSDVQVLHTKLRSIGAQKAIFVTSTGFQRGAVEFASRYQISLALSNGSSLHFTMKTFMRHARTRQERYLLAA